MMQTVISLIRIKHWIKNLFIFLPAFFGGVLFKHNNLQDLLIGFFVFSLVASSIYIINDIRDLEQDKSHPEKSKRVLAAGKITVRKAIYVFVALLFFACFLSLSLPIEAIAVISIYFLLNLFYSLGGKNVAILDITIVSLGFVLRVIVGGVIVGVLISKWLFLLTFLLSLFLVIAKRRDDYLVVSNNEAVRKVSKKYNLEFINNSLIIVSALIMVSYIMYTFSTPYTGIKEYIIFSSSLLVIMGILRYYQIIFVENNSGSPTDIFFKDNFIRILISLWVLLYAFVIYMK